MDVLLECNVPVDIVLEGGWHMTATVRSITDETVELASAEGPLALPGELRWCTATISWRTRVGAAHRHGVLVDADEGHLLLHAHGEPLRIQRREYVRVPADLSAALIGEHGRLLSRTLDVSLGGMLVAEADSIALGERLRFALDLGPLTISGSGQVVRGSGSGTRGVRFEELQGHAERALSRYIAQRQRELLREGRAAS